MERSKSSYRERAKNEEAGSYTIKNGKKIPADSPELRREAIEWLKKERTKKK